MVRTAIQLQTLESLPEDLPETIARVGSTSLEGVEFAGLNGERPIEVAEALDRASLEPVGAHLSLDQLEREYDDIVDAYETIGCTRLIESGRHRDAFADVERLERFAERLDTIADQLDNDGFEFLYHNEVFEFEKLGEETAFDVLAAATGPAIEFEIDTGLVQYAGIDPQALISQYSDRTPLIHLTDSVADGTATVNVELGAGELDVEGAIETARTGGVEWIVYKHSMTSDPIGSLTHAETRLSFLCHGEDGLAYSSPVHSTD